MNILTESMRNLIDALKKRKNAWEKYAGCIHALPYGEMKYYPDVYRTLILFELFAPYGPGIDDIMQALKISRPTQQRILDNIKERGLLKVDESSKKFSYGISLEKIDELLKKK